MMMVMDAIMDVDGHYIQLGADASDASTAKSTHPLETPS
jgi:hypothetical protein